MTELYPYAILFSTRASFSDHTLLSSCAYFARTATDTRLLIVVAHKSLRLPSSQVTPGARRRGLYKHGWGIRRSAMLTCFSQAVAVVFRQVSHGVVLWHRLLALITTELTDRVMCVDHTRSRDDY